MDISSLQFKASLTFDEGEEKVVAWLAAEEYGVNVEPIFTAFEGERGSLRFLLPKDDEMEHLTRKLALSVRVTQSDISGLLLTFETVSAEFKDSWSKLLGHIQERLGKMARIHPRISVPEFNLSLALGKPATSKGKVFDLSVGGMRVLSDLPTSVGEKIEFTFEIPKVLVWAEFLHGVSWSGTVRTCYPRGFGVLFDESHPFGESIKKLIDQLTVRRAQRLVHPRYNIYDFQAEATLENGESVQLKDISISASYVISNQTLPLDTEVILHVKFCKDFETLRTPLSLKGRVARVTPDGLVIIFPDLAEEPGTRLTAWVKEVAGKFSSFARKEETPVKATFSVNYGSDLLFVREYLYNLSSGGLFLPGIASLAKGDAVKFNLDVSGTSLADKFPAPLSFFATVVRTSEQGVGVQFNDPGEVRAQLEGVMGDYIRKHGSTSAADSIDRATQHAQAALDEKSQPPTTQLRRWVPSPLQGMMLLAIGVVIIGLGILGYREKTPTLEVQMETIPEATRVAGTPRVRRKETPLPESVTLVAGSLMYEVVLADITDVTYGEQDGFKVVMRSGQTFPGEGLIRYLSPSLRAKVAEIEKKNRPPVFANEPEPTPTPPNPAPVKR